MFSSLKPTKARTDQRERDLRDLFVAWRKRPPSRGRIAGKPRSLSFATDPLPERAHVAWGHRSFVDIVGDADDGRRLVIELKLGKKFEPLGIPEVLFHAERLSAGGKRAHAVLVTQYNLWNRVVISALRQRAPSLRLDYYEVSVVDLDRRPCFWFDAPLDCWILAPRAAGRFGDVVDQVRTALPRARWLRETLHWYEVRETGSFIAVPARMPRRPAVLDVPHIHLAPIADGDHRWLVWAGVPPPPDATRPGWPVDRYWIWSGATRP